MRTIFLFLTLLISSTIAHTQEYGYLQENENLNAKKHSVYAELGGTALLYSVNYDYTFLRNNKPKFNLGIGASLVPWPEWDSGSGYTPLPIITAQANLLIGKEKHFLETGVSLLYIIPGARIGYRYQPTEGGFLFRAAFTPFYVPGGGISEGLGGITPWAGVSFGYTF